MRVIHVNDIASVGSTLADEQRRHGMDAVVIDPAKPLARLPYPWKLASVPLRAWPLIEAARRARSGRFDLVHVHYATHALVGPLSGRPFVVHCHGSDVRGVTPASPAGRYLQAVVRRAAAVLYSTPDLKPWARGLRADAVWLPNPIDVGRFTPAGEPDRDVLLGVRLDPIKGAEVAIEALAQLVADRPGTTVTVIAQGPLAKDAVRRLGPDTIVQPPVRHDQMPALLQRHRVTLGQFRLGIFSQFELEALACGVPVVADVRHAEPGHEPVPVVQASDAGGAASALHRLLDDPPGRTALGASGREWVARTHGVEPVVERLGAIYRDVLDT